MTQIQRLRLELLIREQHQQFGEEFFTELERILSLIDTEQNAVPPAKRFQVL
jgi:hypothetical protein